MTTSHQHRPIVDADNVLVETDVVTHSAARKGLAVLRLAYGVTFLWAFFDKLLGLGFHTGAITNEEGVRTGIDFMAKDAAWLNGGSPTEGFLMFGVPAHNPFKDIFNNMAGQPIWVDWLFMLGLLGIGVALFTGVGVRIAAGAGVLLYTLMYLASIPLDNNPVVDDHMIGAIVVVVLALTLAGDTWGFGRQWARTNLVRKYPVLR